MTPKEKASDLLEKFHKEMYEPKDYQTAKTVTYTNKARECTLICINAVLQSYQDDVDAGYTSTSIKNNIEYWHEVKKEIQQF